MQVQVWPYLQIFSMCFVSYNREPAYDPCVFMNRVIKHLENPILCKAD